MSILTKSWPSAPLKYLVMICRNIPLLGSVTMWITESMTWWQLWLKGCSHIYICRSHIAITQVCRLNQPHWGPPLQGTPPPTVPIGQIQTAVTQLCLKSLGLQRSWYGETDCTNTYMGPISASCAVCICAVPYYSVSCKNTSWVTYSPAEVKMAEVSPIQCAWWVYAWVARTTQACVCLCCVSGTVKWNELDGDIKRVRKISLLSPVLLDRISCFVLNKGLKWHVRTAHTCRFWIVQFFSNELWSLRV